MRRTFYQQNDTPRHAEFVERGFGETIILFNVIFAPMALLLLDRESHCYSSKIYFGVQEDFACKVN